jgi:hypothetical protein
VADTDAQGFLETVRAARRLRRSPLRPHSLAPHRPATDAQHSRVLPLCLPRSAGPPLSSQSCVPAACWTWCTA